MKLGERMREGILGHAATAGFYLYAIFAAPPLARALKEGLADPQPVRWPGVLLLAVLVLEPIGLRWKALFLRRRNRDESFEPQGSMMGLASAVVIGHMIVSVLVGMIALDCLGLAGEGANPAWMGAASVVLVFKDLLAFFSTGGSQVSREPPGHWKEHLADAILLAFGCLAYTAWWQGLLDLGDISSESLGMKLALVPLLGGLFMFFYLPMRVPFVMDECYLQPAQGRKARISFELVLGALLGLYPAFL